MHYLDTSVLVAALTREEATARVQAWLAAQPAGSLAVSEWVNTEFASALSMKVRTGQLGTKHRAAVLAGYRRLVEESFRIFPVEAQSFRMAALHLNNHHLGLRAGDALHIAVALANGATLGTLDRRMAETAAGVGAESTLL